MENSKILLERAIRSLDEGGVDGSSWVVGGGTVLASVYSHRTSKDIDIFITDPQLLARISPRFNSVTEDALDYNETNSFVSLTFFEGKIDFINASQISKFSPSRKNFLGYDVFVEDPVEIVSKKMFFRGKYALPRDVFDLAVVYDSDRRKDLLETFSCLTDEVSAFERAFLCGIDSNGFVPYSLSNQDMLLPSNTIVNGCEVDICRKFLNDLRSLNAGIDSVVVDHSWAEERIRKHTAVVENRLAGIKKDSGNDSNGGVGGGRS